MQELSRTIVATVISALLFSGALYAADEPEHSAPVDHNQRVCVDADIVGHYYKMVDFLETPPRQDTAWEKNFPYEYLTFSKNNIYSALASNIEYKTPKELERFLKPGQNLNLKYTLSKDGVLNFIDYDRIRLSYRCVTVLKPAGVYIPGDLILRGYTRKAKSEIYKLYRRWY